MTTIKYHDHEWTRRAGSNVETCRGCRAWRGTGEPIAAIDAHTRACWAARFEQARQQNIDARIDRTGERFTVDDAPCSCVLGSGLPLVTREVARVPESYR